MPLPSASVRRNMPICQSMACGDVTGLCHRACVLLFLYIQEVEMDRKEITGNTSAGESIWRNRKRHQCSIEKFVNLGFKMCPVRIVRPEIGCMIWVVQQKWELIGPVMILWSNFSLTVTSPSVPIVVLPSTVPHAAFSDMSSWKYKPRLFATIVHDGDRKANSSGSTDSPAFKFTSTNETQQIFSSSICFDVFEVLSAKYGSGWLQ